MYPNKILLALFGLVLFTAPSIAQSWTGNVNADWNNAQNWSSWPLDGQDIIIDTLFYSGNAMHPEITSVSSFQPNTLTIQNGARLKIFNNLSTADHVEVIGAGSLLTMESGTFSVGAGNKGRLIMDLGGEMIMNGGILLVDQRLISGMASTITINGGNITANQRLLMDMGGLIVMNDGIVSVGETLALADGDSITGVSCRFEMNGGQLTVTGEMAFENEADNYEPTFIQTGGVLNVNGDIFWFGEAPGFGTPKMIVIGGTVNLQGNLYNMPQSTVNMHLSIQDSGIFNLQGSLFETISANDSVIQKGENSQFNLLLNGNWNHQGVFMSEQAHTSINGNGIVNLSGSGQVYFHDISVHANASFNQLIPHIFIKGDFINQGTFQANTHQVTFNGVIPQIINPLSNITFHHLTVNNSHSEGVAVNNHLLIAHRLDLLQGRILVAHEKALTFADNATVSNATSQSYIQGLVKKIGDDDFVFPLGNPQRLGLIGISAPSSTNSQFSVAFYNEKPGQSTSIQAPLVNISDSLYWDLESDENNEQVKVELYWDNIIPNGLSNCNDLTIAQWDGQYWNHVDANTTNCSVDSSGTITSSSTPSHFKKFTFGSLGLVSSQTIRICEDESVMVGESNYTESGTYLDVFKTTNNEDSTVITHLTVNPIPITNQQINLCFGESYIFGNNIYSTSGNYSDTLVSYLACDSIINTHLIIEEAIDISLSQLGTTLTAFNTTADAYQWIDCSTQLPIEGENLSNFSPSASGSFKVIIYKNNCADTSACMEVNVLGLEKTDLENVQIFPNPNEGFISIIGLSSSSEFTLTNLSGKVIYQGKVLSSTNHQINITRQPKGLYILEIRDGEGIRRLKLMKN